MENSMEAPQKPKNRTALLSSNTTPRDIFKGKYGIYIQWNFIHP
jgi:hypothetical protein